MRITKALAISAGALALVLSPVSLAHADMATPAPASSSAPQQLGGPDDQRGPNGHDEHQRIDDGREGADSIQWMFVGAAIVIALGLAYNAGRRQRKKKAE